MARLCFLLLIILVVRISNSQFRRRQYQVRVRGNYILQWTHWSPCTVTCGPGTRSRQRNCNIHRRSIYGQGCQTQTQICIRPSCPRYGGFNQWSQWSSCSVTCGGGQSTRSRSRSYNRRVSRNRRRHNLVNNRVERRNCNNNPCPRNGGFSVWGHWSLCSRTCGGGQRIRYRTCTNPVPAYGGSSCNGNFNTARTCNTRQCPVDGGFSNWNTWSSCSVSCGNGIKSRSRTCTNPSPANGGRNCFGAFVEELNCNPLPCPVDGGFSNWNTWSSCSVSCSNGIKSRSRTCTNPSPANGGRNCSGEFREELNCNSLPCPVDGGFSNWNTWSICSVSCGNGIKSRSRTCNNPSPANGGRNCSGAFVEELNCNPLPCPVHGGFTNWNAWSSCSVSCGNGKMSRSRTCTNPSPANGGRNCSGAFVEELNCNPLPCPVDGGFSNWNTWSSCSVSCGNGMKSRSRTCTNPSPANGGRNCSGEFREELSCNTRPCPVDGGFSDWNAWSSCSVSCGNGIKSRSRTCNNPSPANGGRNCSGAFVEELNCNPLPCPVDGGFSNWNAWSSCSVSCGNGTMTRSRTCTNPSPAYGGRNCSSDFVDELNCNLLPCSVCTAGQFECKTKTCIPIGYKCDGYPDCLDGSDESDDVCNMNDLCPEGQIRCANGQCVTQSYLCS